jgi:hypothetical protein
MVSRRRWAESFAMHLFAPDSPCNLADETPRYMRPRLSPRIGGRAFRLFVEDRPTVADHVPTRAHVGPQDRGAPAASRVGLPVNLFDAMRIVPAQAQTGLRATVMSDRLSLAQIAVLVSYAGAMAGGQLLFKMAALRAIPDRSSSG